MVIIAWSGYNSLARVGYNHLVVVHKRYKNFQYMLIYFCVRNFVDPVTGAHTQGIERCWKSWKDYVRRARCVREDKIASYLYAWVFVFNRTQSGVPRNQIIDDILTCFV